MKASLLPIVACGMLSLACSHSLPRPPEPSAALPPPPASTVQGVAPGDPPPRTLEQMLTGKLSGVTVTPLAGGGIAVRMMSPTSYNDANEGPLFIVDGTQVQTIGGALPWINPRDIESITALRNPGDIAIYGVRGGNGVIVIKTKNAH